MEPSADAIALRPRMGTHALVSLLDVRSLAVPSAREAAATARRCGDRVRRVRALLAPRPVDLRVVDLQ